MTDRTLSPASPLVSDASGTRRPQPEPIAPPNVNAFFDGTYVASQEGAVYDAVYEDLDSPEIASEAEGPFEPEAVSEDEPVAAEAPAIQMDDPFTPASDPTGSGKDFGDGPAFDTVTGGFQIGFDM
ncbi:MAG: hypothetical protein IIB09_04300, partial [Bacteroidetes bacterium]|nr:hypothetical protein [Bacteroidota bacterium]